jgi:hypothetical protein
VEQRCVVWAEVHPPTPGVRWSDEDSPDTEDRTDDNAVWGSAPDPWIHDGDLRVMW